MIEIIQHALQTGTLEKIEKSFALREAAFTSDKSSIGQTLKLQYPVDSNDNGHAVHFLRWSSVRKADAYVRLIPLGHADDSTKTTSCAPQKLPAEYSHRECVELERFCVDTQQNFRSPKEHRKMCTKELFQSVIKFCRANGVDLVAGYAEMGGLEELSDLGLSLFTVGTGVDDGDRYLHRFIFECSEQNALALSPVSIVQIAPPNKEEAVEDHVSKKLHELACLVANADQKNAKRVQQAPRLTVVANNG